MSTPTLVILWLAMIGIAWLVGLEPWMIAVGAVIALFGYLLERQRD
ncbi:MAG: hypothetical protein IT305_01735 [Chloroflexi bacterium]|nr:hypothetical protein [Chloroflexota bacterium]